MGRQYVKDDKGKWNIFSNISDSYLFDEFVSYGLLEQILVGEVVQDRIKSLRTLQTDKPEFNVATKEEIDKEIALLYPEPCLDGRFVIGDRRGNYFVIRVGGLDGLLEGIPDFKVATKFLTAEIANAYFWLIVDHKELTNITGNDYCIEEVKTNKEGVDYVERVVIEDE